MFLPLQLLYNLQQLKELAINILIKKRSLTLWD
nr:MAG TPA: hypothetical protein [Caudoviricetes sp.]